MYKDNANLLLNNPLLVVINWEFPLIILPIKEDWLVILLVPFSLKLRSRSGSLFSLPSTAVL